MKVRHFKRRRIAALARQYVYVPTQRTLHIAQLLAEAYQLLLRDPSPGTPEAFELEALVQRARRLSRAQENE